MSELKNSRIKVLSPRLPQCLGVVNTLIAEGCSETGPAKHSSNQVIWSE